MMFRIMIVVIGRFGGSMLVKMEYANEEEDSEDAYNHPPHTPIDVSRIVNAVWQQMEKADPQHQTAYEADHQLHTDMRETYKGR